MFLFIFFSPPWRHERNCFNTHQAHGLHVLWSSFLIFIQKYYSVLEDQRVLLLWVCCGKPKGHQGFYGRCDLCINCKKNHFKQYYLNLDKGCHIHLGAANIHMKHCGSQGNSHISYFYHPPTFFWSNKSRLCCLRGIHRWWHPCGLPGGRLAACIRRVDASSYYDNDGALPSMCAAHWGAKLSLHGGIKPFGILADRQICSG